MKKLHEEPSSGPLRSSGNFVGSLWVGFQGGPLWVRRVRFLLSCFWRPVWSLSHFVVVESGLCASEVGVSALARCTSQFGGVGKYKAPLS